MRKYTIKDGIIIGFTAPKVLVKKLDSVADKEGVPRAVIMRRIFIRHFQSKRTRATP